MWKSYNSGFTWHDDMFSCFDKIPACDGRTDRQTTNGDLATACIRNLIRCRTRRAVITFDGRTGM